MLKDCTTLLSILIIQSFNQKKSHIVYNESMILDHWPWPHWVRKALKQLNKREPGRAVEFKLGSFTFAFWIKRWISVLTLFHFLFKHLEGHFLHFPSAFNRIQLHILADKWLTVFNLRSGIVGLDFRLSCRHIPLCTGERLDVWCALLLCFFPTWPLTHYIYSVRWAL